MTAMMRAKDFVSGSEVSFNAGALASCALCCYAAVFWAQIAVLEKLGIRQREWKHGDLWSRFGLDAIKKRRIFDTHDADVIRNAYRFHTIAHYRTDELSAKQIERLLRHTKEFVQKAKEVTRK
ncbi:MAG: HEPN domain-containing protein [Armatimonadetes bacterium]|nr:HEPN domain-containing protein [Armatimonadota bacterium]